MGIDELRAIEEEALRESFLIIHFGVVVPQLISVREAKDMQTIVDDLFAQEFVETVLNADYESDTQQSQSYSQFSQN